jgi:asparagine N-glycosylation enzyme membrane subunit Stt3
MKPDEIKEVIDFDHPRIATIIIYFVTGAITVKIVWNRVWPAVVLAGIIALTWYTWPTSKLFIIGILGLYALAIVVIVLVVVIGFAVPSQFIERNWGKSE